MTGAGRRMASLQAGKMAYGRPANGFRAGAAWGGKLEDRGDSDWVGTFEGATAPDGNARSVRIGEHQSKAGRPEAENLPMVRPSRCACRQRGSQNRHRCETRDQ
jgi:hypothetical protein